METRPTVSANETGGMITAVSARRMDAADEPIITAPRTFFVVWLQEQFSTMEIVKKLEFEQGDNVSRPVYFSDTFQCNFCWGSGEHPTRTEAKCHHCLGKGEIVAVPPYVACLKCSGSGRESWEMSCTACHGLGFITVDSEMGTCDHCRGTGGHGFDSCHRCDGQGVA